MSPFLDLLVGMGSWRGEGGVREGPEGDPGVLKRRFNFLCEKVYKTNKKLAEVAQGFVSVVGSPSFLGHNSWNLV